MKWVTHSHDDEQPFRSDDAYMLAHACSVPTCRAPAGHECVEGRARGHRFHQRRQDAGVRHWRKDSGAAPWPEEQEPGVCYSTLPGCE